MVLSDTSTEDGAAAPGVTSGKAGLVGFAAADAEPIVLMLDILGWQVDAVQAFSELSSNTYRLLFIDKSQAPAASALLALLARLNATLAMVGSTEVYHVTDNGRVHHLPAPLDAAELEHVIEAAS